MKKQFLFLINLLFLSTIYLCASTDSSITALEDKAYNALKNNEPDIARTYYLQLIQENPDSAALKAMCYNNLGTIDIKEGFNVRGFDYLQKAIKTYEQVQNDTLLAKTLYNAGRIYKLRGQYEKATELLLRALRIFEENKLNADLSKTYNVLGNLYRDLNDLETALRYNKLACDVAVDIKDSSLLAKHLNNKGSTYLDMEFFEEAIKDFKRSLLIKEKIKLEKSIPYSYFNLGEAEFLRGNATKAIDYFSMALKQNKQYNNKRKVAYCYSFLGRAYAAQQKWDKAKDYYNKAQALASSLDIVELLMNNNKYQFELHEAQDNNKLALKHYKLYGEQYEKLLNINKQTAIHELQIKYEVEKKEQENDILSQKAELDQFKIKQQETSLRLWRIITIAAIVLILLILFLVYKLYRLFGKEKKLAEKEKQLNREQHHRIKNHLQILAGLLSFQQKKIENSAAKEVIRESSNRVEVIKMLHLHFYQSGDYNSHTIQLHSYLQEIIENLVVLFNKTDIQVEKDIDHVMLSPDKALPLGLICNEIISNALKYGLDQGAKSILSIELKKGGKRISLMIKDNGKADITHSSSSSIGLDLIDQLAKQIDAKIDRDFSEGAKYTLNFSL